MHDDNDGRGAKPRLKAQNDYDVGYGKPPPANRFKKGGSGNPSGRPKKQKSFVDVLGKALSREVVVKAGGKKVRRSLRELTAHQLAAKMAEGDLSAIKLGKDFDPYFRPAPEDDGPMTFILDFPEEEERRAQE